MFGRGIGEPGFRLMVQIGVHQSVGAELYRLQRGGGVECVHDGEAVEFMGGADERGDDLPGRGRGCWSGAPLPGEKVLM